MMKKNSYLITGGTGSFGKAFVKKLIQQNKKISRLIIFSRDELKQYEMSKLYPADKYPFMRFFRYSDKMFIISHWKCRNKLHAAFKTSSTTEYNPFKRLKLILLELIIWSAALENNIKMFGSITDKTF